MTTKLFVQLRVKIPGKREVALFETENYGVLAMIRHDIDITVKNILASLDPNDPKDKKAAKAIKSHSNKIERIFKKVMPKMLINAPGTP